MRKFLQLVRNLISDRSGELASDHAILLSLATLGSLLAFAMVGVMPDDFVEFALESLGGAIGLVE